MELRDDLVFYFDQRQRKVDSSHLINLKLMGGMRYYIMSWETIDWTAKLKLGGLLPVSNFSRAEFGTIWGGSTELFYKWSKKQSLAIDLYYDLYKQDYRTRTIKRTEIGAMGTYVFKW